MARQIGAYAEDDGRLELYEQGLTDKEIGKALFLTAGSIYGWRHRRGYKANGGTGNGGLRVNNKCHINALRRNCGERMG